MNQKPFLAVGLDAGSTHTRCVILTLEESRLRFLGYGDTPSVGWKKSRIADHQAVTACILQTVQQAEAMARYPVETVTVGCGGVTVRGANTRSRIELGRPREIEQRDVKRSLERASRPALQEDRMILQLFPQDFVVDDHPGHRDPRKMLASCIEANAHVITVSTQEHTSLIGAVNQAHLGVDESVFEALAACYASVLPDDRREGLALVDIGAHSTDLVVYYGDALQLATSLPICGDHFTRDLAHFLRLSYDDAVLVKEVYGSAVAAHTSSNSFIELPMNERREPREASRRRINETIEIRAEELFRMVAHELSRVGMERSLTSGLVLAGAGARLYGMCDIAERVLDCQARIGLPVGICDWPEELNDPSWSACAGLAMYSARLRTQVDLERQSIGLLGRILR